MNSPVDPSDPPEAKATARRHPLEVLDSLSASGPSAPSVTPIEPILIQDWRPLSESLEWRLSNRSWVTSGSDLFVRGEVPYVVNNTGWIAEGMAAVVLASLAEAGNRPERIWILELGAGLGLFARQFLDAFRDLCLSSGRDEYDRLIYCVTDGSERTVRRWIDSNLFHGHSEHVEIGTCDARDPRRILLAANMDGEQRVRELPPGSVHLVIANYLLDSLPATIVRRASGSDWEEMRVRTYLEPAAQTEVDYRFHLQADDVKRLAQAWEEEDSSGSTYESAGTLESRSTSVDVLVRVLPYFAFEIAFDAPARLPHRWGELASLDLVTDRMVLSQGAIDCLDAALELLGEDGLIFYRDLGPVSWESMPEQSYSARFGSTIVATVNFPLLDGRLRARGLKVVSPDGDEQRSIHTRLALRGSLPDTERVFAEHFDHDRYGIAQSAAAEAVRYVNANQFESALASYRSALELCPTDWQLLGQVAQFLTQQMLRAPEALELVEQALEINGAFSAFLWNTLGNCHYVLGDVEKAHGAYLRAREIDSRDVQTHLNLAYTQASLGELEEALMEVAIGLACDSDGRFETSLLKKQQEILVRLEQRRREDSERSAARHQAFTSLPARPDLGLERDDPRPQPKAPS